MWTLIALANTHSFSIPTYSHVISSHWILSFTYGKSGNRKCGCIAWFVAALTVSVSQASPSNVGMLNGSFAAPKVSNRGTNSTTIERFIKMLWYKSLFSGVSIEVVSLLILNSAPLYHSVRSSSFDMCFFTFDAPKVHLIVWDRRGSFETTINENETEYVPWRLSSFGSEQMQHFFPAVAYVFLPTTAKLRLHNLSLIHI